MFLRLIKWCHRCNVFMFITTLSCHSGWWNPCIRCHTRYYYKSLTSRNENEHFFSGFILWLLNICVHRLSQMNALDEYLLSYSIHGLNLEWFICDIIKVDCRQNVIRFKSDKLRDMKRSKVFISKLVIEVCQTWGTESQEVTNGKSRSNENFSWNFTAIT